LIFSLQEKEVLTTKEILTPGSPLHAPIENVAFSGKYSDTNVRYKTCYARGGVL